MLPAAADGRAGSMLCRRRWMEAAARRTGDGAGGQVKTFGAGSERRLSVMVAITAAGAKTQKL